MIERTTAGLGQAQSYYFQLCPVNLILRQEPLPSVQSKFKFMIYKGSQKSDENRLMPQSNFIQNNGSFIMALKGCQLNFYLPAVNRAKNLLFTLKLNQKQNTQEYELGSVDIDSSIYIDQFKQTGQRRFQERVQISEQYLLQYQIYIQKSRFNLQKLVKSYKNQKSMVSPVRQQRSTGIFNQRKLQLNQLQSEIFPLKSPTRSNIIERTKSIKKANQIIQIKNKSQIILADQNLKNNENSINDKKHQIQIRTQKKQIQTKSIKSPNYSQDLQNQKSQRAKNLSSQQEQKVMSNKKKQVHEIMSQKKKKSDDSSLRESKKLNNQDNKKDNKNEHKNEHKNENNMKKVQQNWQQHIKLVILTVVGIFIIYYTMHPTRKV